MRKIKYIGFDVHKEKIFATVYASNNDEPISQKSFLNTKKCIREFIESHKKGYKIMSCYEAGCTGFPLHRYLTELGVENIVVPPNKVPKKPGNRVKTDKIDSKLLARMLKANELKGICVPTLQDEAVRDFIRLREDVRLNRRKERQRIAGFLLRNDLIYSGNAWTKAHEIWLRSLKFYDENKSTTFELYLMQLEQIDFQLASIEKKIIEIANSEPYKEKVSRLRCFKGIDYLSALSLIVEVGDFSRFSSAPQFMSYLGLTPIEYSSGGSRSQGGISKTGNAYLRRILTECAWNYTRVNQNIGSILKKRRDGMSLELIQYADKAIPRLKNKYFKLVKRGKNGKAAITSVARELSGFIWGAMTYNY
ncbi:MAG: IS110 family transposase [Leptospira sp.]|nr:IS110 family transposase [Leptospira sp.]